MGACPKDPFIRGKLHQGALGRQVPATEYFRRFPKDSVPNRSGKLAKPAIAEHRVYHEAVARADRWLRTKREAILADFKRFTTVDGRTVWVNIDEILLAEPFNEGKQRVAMSRITLVGGTQISRGTTSDLLSGTE